MSISAGTQQDRDLLFLERICGSLIELHEVTTTEAEPSKRSGRVWLLASRRVRELGPATLGRVICAYSGSSFRNWDANLPDTGLSGLDLMRELATTALVEYIAVMAVVSPKEYGFIEVAAEAA